jgi:hypothetical protein
VTDVDKQRWSLRYHADRVTMEPPENSCRSYPCCGGDECGFTLEEARAEIVAYRQRELDALKAMTPQEFLASQGY